MEPETKSNSSKRLLIILLLILAALAAVVYAIHALSPRPAEILEDSGTPKIGYAEGVVAVEQDGLQAAVDKMYEAAENSFVTEYKNDARSADGVNFTCYVGNSSLNNYDAYIQIFADAELSDQLFLSGLLRPGTAFKEITLDHALDVGTHRVYVIFTQVEEDLATLHGQVTLTMDFTVTE